MTVKGAPGPWKVDEQEAELRDLTMRLQDANRALICWKRRGGGVICSRTVQVQVPGEPRPRETTDAELAVILKLGHEGSMLVTWPFSPNMDPSAIHAPIDEAIVAAASVL